MTSGSAAAQLFFAAATRTFGISDARATFIGLKFSARGTMLVSKFGIIHVL